MQKEYGTEDIFVQAQTERRKILITYFSGQYNLFLTKLCIPIRHLNLRSEYGPDFFYFWDDEADVGERIIGLPPSEIKHIEITDEAYNPNDYI